MKPLSELVLQFLVKAVRARLQLFLKPDAEFTYEELLDLQETLKDLAVLVGEKAKAKAPTVKDQEEPRHFERPRFGSGSRRFSSRPASARNPFRRGEEDR